MDLFNNDPNQALAKEIAQAKPGMESNPGGKILGLLYRTEHERLSTYQIFYHFRDWPKELLGVRPIIYIEQTLVFYTKQSLVQSREIMDIKAYELTPYFRQLIDVERIEKQRPLAKSVLTQSVLDEYDDELKLVRGFFQQSDRPSTLDDIGRFFGLKGERASLFNAYFGNLEKHGVVTRADIGGRVVYDLTRVFRDLVNQEARKNIS